MKATTRRQAFTLIELLVVISVIALLVGILLPALSAARRTAREAICLTQVRSFVTANFTYQADEGTFPPVWVARPSRNGRTAPIWSQRLIQDGYVGEDRSLAVQRCPLVMSELPTLISDIFGKSDTDGVFTYGMNAFIGGVPVTGSFPYVNQPKSSDDVRETSRTMLVGERYFPSTMLLGTGRAAAAIHNRGWMGIPHMHSEVNGGATYQYRGVSLPSREGTNNMGFADGSGRAVRGEQTRHNVAAFEDGDTLIIEQNPFFSSD